MKKKLIALLFVGLSLFTGCSSSNQETDVITVGASSVPHAEILEEARPLIEKQGYKLDIKIFDDYVLPNEALESGDLDANYFQHVPYLEQQEEEFGYDFVPVANVHIEPIRIYSKEYKSIEDIKPNSTLILSNSVSDQSRILALLDENDVITLKDGIEPGKATFDDIAENPLNLQFDADYDPSLLPSIYENGEGDLVAINTNYALGAGINSDEALFSEGEDSEYANALVVRKEDENNEKTKVLVDALTSQEVQDFINEEYNGAVIPASNE